MTNHEFSPQASDSSELPAYDDGLAEATPKWERFDSLAPHEKQLVEDLATETEKSFGLNFASSNLSADSKMAINNARQQNESGLEPLKLDYDGWNQYGMAAVGHAVKRGEQPHPLNQVPGLQRGQNPGEDQTDKESLSFLPMITADGREVVSVNYNMWSKRGLSDGARPAGRYLSGFELSPESASKLRWAATANPLVVRALIEKQINHIGITDRTEVQKLSPRYARGIILADPDKPEDFENEKQSDSRLYNAALEVDVYSLDPSSGKIKPVSQEITEYREGTPIYQGLLTDPELGDDPNMHVNAHVEPQPAQASPRHESKAVSQPDEAIDPQLLVSRPLPPRTPAAQENVEPASQEDTVSGRWSEYGSGALLTRMETRLNERSSQSEVLKRRIIGGLTLGLAKAKGYLAATSEVISSTSTAVLASAGELKGRLSDEGAKRTAQISGKLGDLKLGERLDDVKLGERVADLKIGERLNDLQVGEKLGNLKDRAKALGDQLAVQAIILNNKAFYSETGNVVDGQPERTLDRRKVSIAAGIGVVVMVGAAYFATRGIHTGGIGRSTAEAGTSGAGAGGSGGLTGSETTSAVATPDAAPMAPAIPEAPDASVAPHPSDVMPQPSGQVGNGHDVLGLGDGHASELTIHQGGNVWNEVAKSAGFDPNHLSGNETKAVDALKDYVMQHDLKGVNEYNMHAGMQFSIPDDVMREILDSYEAA